MYTFYHLAALNATKQLPDWLSLTLDSLLTDMPSGKWAKVKLKGKFVAEKNIRLDEHSFVLKHIALAIARICTEMLLKLNMV